MEFWLALNRGMRRHAFSSDPVYDISRNHSDPMIMDRIRAFKENVEAAEGVRIGRDSWVINGVGRKSAINFSRGSVLRGGVRVEYFGRGEVKVGEHSYI